jgi:long-chain fatty acid adenylase/transferase FadD26
VIESSIPAVLEGRARQKPDDVAYTFVDYEVDPAGFAESLTWSQVIQRARVVADELSVCGSVGDRAVILTPQGLDYVVAFLGALQAGFIAVPLSVPQFTHDERVPGVLRDCSPVAILTTSAVVDAVMPLSGAQPGGSVPSVVEVDALDLDSPRMLDAGGGRYVKAAYLQYTAGSTRQPAGVMVSHRNLVTNFKQVMSDFFEDYGKVPPPDTTIVSWLPFYCRVEEAGRLGRGGAAQASHHQPRRPDPRQPGGADALIDQPPQCGHRGHRPERVLAIPHH